MAPAVLILTRASLGSTHTSLLLWGRCWQTSCTTARAAAGVPPREALLKHCCRRQASFHLSQQSVPAFGPTHASPVCRAARGAPVADVCCVLTCCAHLMHRCWGLCGSMCWRPTSCCGTCGHASHWPRSSGRRRPSACRLRCQSSTKGAWCTLLHCLQSSSTDTPPHLDQHPAPGCRLQRMEDAASGVERRHITQLLRPVKEAIDAALAKLDASKADSVTMQT